MLKKFRPKKRWVVYQMYRKMRLKEVYRGYTRWGAERWAKQGSLLLVDSAHDLEVVRERS